MTRPPSPADLRCRLAPTHVTALAHVLHTFRCVLLTGEDPYRNEPDHTQTDLAAARYLLTTLRDNHHLHLQPTPHQPAPPQPPPPYTRTRTRTTHHTTEPHGPCQPGCILTAPHHAPCTTH